MVQTRKIALPLNSSDATLFAEPVILVDTQGNIVGTESRYTSTNASTNFGTVSTAASYTTLASAPSKQVTLQNTTGVDILVQKDGTGAAFTLLNGSRLTVNISDASKIAVKRKDGTATSVSVEYIVENW